MENRGWGREGNSGKYQVETRGGVEGLGGGVRVRNKGKYQVKTRGGE